MLCDSCEASFNLGNYENLALVLWYYHRALSEGLNPDQHPKSRCALCSFLLLIRCSRPHNSIPQWPFRGTTIEDILNLPPSPGTMRNVVLYSLESHDFSFHHSRLPKRLVPFDSIDMNMVRSWLHRCELEHGSSCDATYLGRNLLANGELTLVDVHDHCLVRATGSMRYFTLSYVWGRATQLRLLKSNISRLFTPGGLLREPIPIPKTIRDSMEAIKRIGERYIWIDALCIVQDDPADKERQLPRMASIYGESLATIVAVGGTNADEGLPGVRAFSRKPNVLHRWPELGLAVGYRHSFRHTIENSRYNTRGWTYQERLLAKRCIFFSDHQVFFQCRKNLWSEDMWEDVEGLRGIMDPEIVDVMSHWSLLPATKVNQMTFFNSYYIDLVEEYTQKDLTDPGDILNAFAGIMEHTIKTIETHFVCGLYAPVIESFLWYQKTRHSRRREAGEPGKFPSWSWAGWTGGVRYAEFSHQPMYRQILISTEAGKYITLERYTVVPDGCQDPAKPEDTELPSTDLKEDESMYDMLTLMSGENRTNVMYFWAVAARVSMFHYKDEDVPSKGDGGTGEERVTITTGAGKECGCLYGVESSVLQGAYAGEDWWLVLVAAGLDKCSECSTGTPGAKSWCRRNILLIRREDGYSSRWGIGWVHFPQWEAVEKYEILVRLT
jgi:hypothetical protein